MTQRLPVKLSSGLGLRRAAAERYWPDVRRYFLRRVPSADAADDLVQEVCLRFLTSATVTCPRKPLAYLYGIAAHVLADYRRRQARERELLVTGADMTESDIADTNCIASKLAGDESGRQQFLIEALSQLPPKHCLVLLAHKRDGLSYRETATKLNLSVHTVEKYLTQAKAQLRLMCRD